MPDSSRGVRFLSALALALVTMAAMLATCATTMPAGCTKSKAYVTAAKSDLRNLVSAQQEFREKYGRYAAGNEVYSDKFGYFRASTGVRVYVEHADAATFRARSSHTQVPNVTCVVESVDGELRCFDIEQVRELPQWMRNRGINIAVDLWLFAFTLARRQQRLSRATASKEFARAA